MAPDPEAKESLEEFAQGVYLHFKGNLYDAYTVAKDPEDNQTKVYYWALNKDGSPKSNVRYGREAEEFLLDVVHRDGSVCEHTQIVDEGMCTDGQQIADRFHYLGPIYKSWMQDVNPWDLNKV